MNGRIFSKFAKAFDRTFKKIVDVINSEELMQILRKFPLAAILVGMFIGLGQLIIMGLNKLGSHR